MHGKKLALEHLLLTNGTPDQARRDEFEMMPADTNLCLDGPIKSGHDEVGGGIATCRRAFDDEFDRLRSPSP